MGKFSTYRYLELKDETAAPPPQTSSRRVITQPRRLKKVFFLLLVVVLVVTYLTGLFAGQSQWLDGIAKTLGYQSVHHYAVIIDAGSSGSRVLAYRFRVPFTVFGAKDIDLAEEYFEQLKPGLSSFADEPAKGAATIVKLIESAQFLIPEEKRRDTPLLVRATAGLRLLPKEKAQQLLDEVRDAICRLGFDKVNNDSVQIMDGSDEGIFIWYTLNLLHDSMGGSTMAALDLGGGSTQITYALPEHERARYPARDQHAVAAGSANISLYTHSYLNLGLLAARYGIFRLEHNSRGGADNTTEFTSVCVDPIVQKEKWTYANKQYFVSGASRQGLKRDAVYNRCHALVSRYVKNTLDWEPTQPPRGSIAAMSYFYDVAADIGMIDVMKGGTVSVSQYRSHAARACSGSNVEQPWACIDLVYVVTLLQDAYKIGDNEPISYSAVRVTAIGMSICFGSNVEQPWACIDLVYVVTLLQDAYKIGDNEPISLFKKVNGHEVSWALGLAYTTVMNRMAAAAAAEH